MEPRQEIELTAPHLVVQMAGQAKEKRDCTQVHVLYQEYEGIQPGRRRQGRHDEGGLAAESHHDCPPEGEREITQRSDDDEAVIHEVAASNNKGSLLLSSIG